MNKTRLAKAISNKGYCSRRDAEKLILQGLVKLNGKIVSDVVTFVLAEDVIEVVGVKRNLTNTKPRLWLYHKPVGLITTHKDPQGRTTVFEALPIKSDQHIVSVGRLDLNSEGLLLLTNCKSLAKTLEDPNNNFERVYKVRVFGKANKEIFKICQGVEIDGIFYKPIQIYSLSEGVNSWYQMHLREGKNREIRRIFDAFGLVVNRLIRTQYGPFKLDDLACGNVREIELENFTILGLEN